MYRWGYIPILLRFFIVISLVIGIILRFENLEKKVYWHDETFTSLRVSGYTRAEVIQQVFNGREIGIKDLQKYQHINHEKNLIDTVKGLAAEEPQLPPIYFLIVRFWVQWFGDSVAVTRSLSALFSLLVFPCMYWLCLELFESSLVGWVAIALLAVSPFQIQYAQDARPYMLWAVTILLSSVALMRALRLKTKFDWGIYAATVAFGLYTHLLFSVVALGHGIYIGATEGIQRNQTFRKYTIAVLAGLSAFGPWLLLILINLQPAVGSTRWSATKISPLEWVQKWLNNLSYLFVDRNSSQGIVNFNFLNSLPNLSWFFLAGSLAILIGYSLYFTFSKTPKRVSLFVLTLTGVLALILVLPDLFLGGQRSTITRYLVPCWLGVQLAVAYFLATQITTTASIWKQKLWQLVIILLLLSGAFSCASSASAEVWWNSFNSYDTPYPSEVSIINQEVTPLVISDGNRPNSVGKLLSLSHILKPKVRLQVVRDPNSFRVSKGFSNIFLYNTPYKPLQARLGQEYKIEPIYKLSELWRLEKKSDG